MKSEQVPVKNDGLIYKLVGSTFSKIVKDRSKDVMVELYIPTCGACKIFEQVYD